MTAIHHYNCSKCDFTCAEFSPEVRFVARVYEFGQNRIAPLLRRQAWCEHCQLLTQAERIPSLSDIEKQVASYQKLLSGEGGFDRYTLALKKLAEKYVAYAQLWKEWATSHAHRQGNCLNCGHAVDALPASGANDAGDTYMHADCGGTLYLKQVLDIEEGQSEGPEILRYSPDGIVSTVPVRVSASGVHLGASPTKYVELPAGKGSSLHRNPFWLLDASPRDRQQRIDALSKEKSHELGSEVCQKARAVLSDPRSRLHFEMAWLPGVPADKAVQLLDLLIRDPSSVRIEKNLPSLAYANLMVAAFEQMDSRFPIGDVVNHIEKTAHIVETIDLEDVRADINADRRMAEFTEVSTAEELKEGLEERKFYFHQAMSETLSRFPTDSLIDIMTKLVDIATGHGLKKARPLINKLVTSYEAESRNFLNKEKENIQKLIQAIRDFSGYGEAGINRFVNELQRVARNWDYIARPLQYSASSSGKEHKESEEVTYQIHFLAVELFNEHDMRDSAVRLVNLLKESFSCLPGLMQRLAKDSVVLEQAEREIQAGKAADLAGEDGISYSAKIGVFRRLLSISSGELSWGKKKYKLNEITRFRRGYTGRSLFNFNRPVFFVAFGDESSEAVAVFSNHKTYSQFAEVLSRAIGARMMENFLVAMQQGKRIQFGDAIVQDEGITVITHRLMAKNKITFVPWLQVVMWAADGCFYLAKANDKKVHVKLPYRDMDNVIVLDTVISMAIQVEGIKKLSELLK